MEQIKIPTTESAQPGPTSFSALHFLGVFLPAATRWDPLEAKSVC